MPAARRLATLAAFVHSLEATAQDDVLEVLEILLHELFGDAEKADKKARLRTLKDLDGAAATLADVCRVLLDPALPDDRVRSRVFEKIPQPLLEHAVENVDALIRPPADVFYKELDARYAAVRRYLPAVLNHVRFEASPAGKPVVQAYDLAQAIAEFGRIDKTLHTLNMIDDENKRRSTLTQLKRTGQK